MNPVYAAAWLTLSISDVIMACEVYSKTGLDTPGFRAAFMFVVFIGTFTFSCFIKEIKK